MNEKMFYVSAGIPMLGMILLLYGGITANLNILAFASGFGIAGVMIIITGIISYGDKEIKIE